MVTSANGTVANGQPQLILANTTANVCEAILGEPNHVYATVSPGCPSQLAWNPKHLPTTLIDNGQLSVLPDPALQLVIPAERAGTASRWRRP